MHFPKPIALASNIFIKKSIHLNCTLHTTQYIQSQYYITGPIIYTTYAIHLHFINLYSFIMHYDYYPVYSPYSCPFTFLHKFYRVYAMISIHELSNKYFHTYLLSYNLSLPIHVYSFLYHYFNAPYCPHTYYFIIYMFV